ncbi:type II secretion system (T2SS) protein M subtype b [Nitrospirillum amazonense]|uniref:Type II secretion system (T2SS) protein M subtype b n=1 Tax=Nitrospirillum amazonense TaxID=28077 RepID=A0A560EJV6_9PROT|nr:GspMb/PilO family protein [Nitrospirillum amazonense]TWB09659.1 type II secretion system (T2SS) protein M subtype b [Nitrospirillum amazonense]
MKPQVRLRPGFVLALVLGISCATLYALSPALIEQVTAAMERRQARSVQLAAARGLAAQRQELSNRVDALGRVVDEGGLFHKGLNVGAAQALIQSAIQSGGAVIRGVGMTMEAVGEGRQRLTGHVALEGSAEAIQGALTQLEAVRPRLLLQEMHIHPAAPGATDGASVMTMDLEVDAYADLTP